MGTSKRPSISARKQPQQARSNALVAAVLKAAVQVLTKQGAPRFTMARVAEKAGVSVGSLYQYFPNKAAILFRLQSDEWRETSEMLRAILDDVGRPPLDRLRELVHAFIRSECQEAAVRSALSDAAPLYRDAPEADDVRASSEATMQRFMRELLPRSPASARERTAEIVTATLGAVGKQFSERPRSPDEIASYADAVADMFSAYVERARASSRTAARRDLSRRRISRRPQPK